MASNARSLARKAAVQVTLEDLLDTQGLARTLRDLAEVSQEKAAHVADVWQDHGLAALWAEAAQALWAAAEAAPVAALAAAEGRPKD